MSADSPDFNSFGLPAALLTTLTELGYETPSPIQAASIPALLEGQDLIGQAQTGTGKTAAFALPLLARLDFAQREPQILVLTPTRELAIQVAEAFQRYARHLPGLHVAPIYGGQSIGLQFRALQRQVHVVVGTPGRVIDHLRRQSLSLSKIKALVLDEADEMLRMGFLEDVTWILEHTPKERQTALFSATMPEPIRAVARTHLRNPLEVRAKTKTVTVEAVRQRFWQVSGLHKLDALTRILEIEDIDAVLVFVRTKVASVELASKLEARGYPCAALNGDLNQSQREKAIEQLKNKQLDVVIATDVAARGLDVPRISHVINYDIPHDIESYIHRIGRTGRAGRSGEAILFVAPREMRMLRAIEQATKQPITPMRTPTRAAIVERRITQFKRTVIDAIATDDLEFYNNLVQEIAQEQGVDTQAIAAGLAYLLQKDKPLQLSAHEVEAEPTETPQANKREYQERRPREQAARPPRHERGERTERAERTERTEPAPRPPRAAKQVDIEPQAAGLKEFPDIEMIRYRIDIGLEHGATPKHIVGAIANEAGLESRYIGRIDIHDEFSTVDLPQGMPKEILQHLKTVRLGRHRFNLMPLTQPQVKGLEALRAEGVQQRVKKEKPRRKHPK